MSTVDLLPNPVEAAAALHAPSERAQEIFYQAVIESRSQREIAKEFQLSQPRVNQIIAKVLVWVGDTLPGVAGEMTARQRFQAAKQITRDRLMYYPGLLVEKFHQSCEPIQVQITKPGCEPEIKIKNGQPKPQLLKAAADIAAKLPRFELEMLEAGCGLRVEGGELREDGLQVEGGGGREDEGDKIMVEPSVATDRPLADAHATDLPATRHTPPTTKTPPNGDLSAAMVDQPKNRPEPVCSPSANPFSKIPCGNTINGHLVRNDFQLPPKKPLSRREQQIERRRQKAAKKQERRLTAASA